MSALFSTKQAKDKNLFWTLSCGWTRLFRFHRALRAISWLHSSGALWQQIVWFMCRRPGAIFLLHYLIRRTGICGGLLHNNAELTQWKWVCFSPDLLLLITVEWIINLTTCSDLSAETNEPTRDEIKMRIFPCTVLLMDHMGRIWSPDRDQYFRTLMLVSHLRSRSHFGGVLSWQIRGCPVPWRHHRWRPPSPAGCPPPLCVACPHRRSLNWPPSHCWSLSLHRRKTNGSGMNQPVTGRVARRFE